MNFENYYLDIQKISQIPSLEDRDQIHRYYMDMLIFFTDGSGREKVSQSIMKTLIKSGYLIDSRDEKLGELLNG